MPRFCASDGLRSPKKPAPTYSFKRAGFRDYTWAFHDNVELGPVMLKKIAKYTGLTPEDL